ncbi:MAG: hypothetical protein LBU22_15240, partial [Dysgonamonadaceae bacterium]|nr:hypothetical protein [Dysgonamonadaceae bacterium]
KFGAVTTTSNIASWDYRASTLTHYNNRFGRMKAITLGYTLPTAWLSKIKIEQLRVYFNGNDLFESKSYPYTIDPESNAYGLYPINRSWTVGIDITF